MALLISGAVWGFEVKLTAHTSNNDINIFY